MSLRISDFAHGDLHVGGLTVGAAHGLVDHHAGMRQGAAASFLAGAEQHAGHRGGKAGADGAHLRLDILHGVVDAEAGVDGASRRVEVDLDILLGVHALEEEQLGLDDVGGVVVDGGAEEDDAVHHQAAEDVHLGHVKLTLLNDIRRERIIDGRSVFGISRAADTTMLGGVFLKFCHIYDCFFVCHNCLNV